MHSGRVFLFRLFRMSECTLEYYDPYLFSPESTENPARRLHRQVRLRVEWRTRPKSNANPIVEFMPLNIIIYNCRDQRPSSFQGHILCRILPKAI